MADNGWIIVDSMSNMYGLWIMGYGLRNIPITANKFEIAKNVWVTTKYG